jgi:hypothetical protein
MHKLSQHFKIKKDSIKLLPKFSIQCEYLGEKKVKRSAIRMAFRIIPSKEIILKLEIEK